MLQALRLLKKDGLLEEAPGRGLVVARLDPVRIGHLYQVRGALDALAARLASERGAKIPLALIDAGRKAGNFTEDLMRVGHYMAQRAAGMTPDKVDVPWSWLGLAGLAAYLWLLAALGLAAWRTMSDEPRRAEAAALACGLLALFIAMKFNPVPVEALSLAALFAPPLRSL